MTWRFYLAIFVGSVVVGVLGRIIRKRRSEDFVSDSWIADHYTSTGHQDSWIAKRSR